MSSRRQEASSRTWWSLSSKSPNIPSAGASANKPSRQVSLKYNGFKFNSIASAIGLKPKRHPSLTIQSPPPVQTTIPASDGLYSAKYRHRPPSKSVSSTRSQGDSLGPRTPVDSQRDTCLSLSEVDPFAKSEHIDPFMSNRISYASSSSHNVHHHGGELLPSSSNQSSTPTPEFPIQNLKSKYVISPDLRNAYRAPDVGSQLESWIASGLLVLWMGP